MTDDLGEGKSWQKHLQISSLPKEVQDKLAAGVDLIGRTGAKNIQIRYSGPPEDEAPTVWNAIAEYVRNGKSVFETAAAMDPLRAVTRLCKQLTDGGGCTHCGRTTIFSTNPETQHGPFCSYKYDAKHKKYVKGCE